ncbi:MAG: DNA polymerase III subunit delta [Rhodospirillaceae bacterium]|nr:MAG: DNA polymerase III subunit delta [Rhodospirillaceae bacterium]
MKVDARRAEGFLAKPDASVRAILLYGPDVGLVRERMVALTRAIAGSTDDPFRTAEFPADSLRSDPARLGDEAAALALTGGRRVVRFRDASDTVAGVFADWLKAPLGDSLVIVTAGELTPRAKLRQVFEDADQAAAVACYTDEADVLARLVRETLKGAGLTVTSEALDWLTDHLGGDRELSRRELEKLVTYMGTGNSTVTAEDVLACIGDTAAFDVDDLIFAMADGDQAAVQRTFLRLTAEGTSPIAVITAAARHLVRLHETRGRLADGRNLEQAVAGLRPPVFFKFKTRFQAQANKWNEALLARGLELLTDAEVAAKSTDMPVEAVAERALIQVAQAARSATRR